MYTSDYAVRRCVRIERFLEPRRTDEDARCLRAILETNTSEEREHICRFIEDDEEALEVGSLCEVH